MNKNKSRATFWRWTGFVSFLIAVVLGIFSPWWQLEAFGYAIFGAVSLLRWYRAI